MAGSFISSDPKKYENFQPVNSNTPMSSSSRTVAGTVEQFLTCRLIFRRYREPARENMTLSRAHRTGSRRSQPW